MNIKKYFAKSLLILFLMPFFSLNAQQLTPRPPLFGIPAKTLPQSHWVFRSYWIYNNFNLMWNSEKKNMSDLPKYMNFYSNVIWGKIRYGITNNLTALVNIPYVNKSFSKNAITKTGNGIGDIIGALLYNFYHTKPAKFWLSGLLFTKLPTGKSTRLSKDELSVGTGSFDYGAALLPEKEFGKWDIRLSAFYLFRNDNNLGVNLGNMMSISWSTAYDFSKKLIAENTVYYKKTFANSKNNIDIIDSDTYLLQFIFGIQYRILHSFLAQLVIPITITQKRPFGNNYETWLGLYYMI